jgi:hypothetical protein
MPIARTATAVVVVGAIVGLIAWHHSSSGPANPAGAVVVRIAGAVVMDEGGGGIPSATSGAARRPIRSAPVLVRGVTVSGGLLQRRLQADHHGRFRLNLPPGTYTFTAILDRASTSIADQPNTTVAVRVGQTGRPLHVWIIASENVTMTV